MYWYRARTVREYMYGTAVLRITPLSSLSSLFHLGTAVLLVLVHVQVQYSPVLVPEES